MQGSIWIIKKIFRRSERTNAPHVLYWFFGTFCQPPNESAQRVKTKILLCKSTLANKSYFMKKIDLLVKKVEKRAFRGPNTVKISENISTVAM